MKKLLATLGGGISGVLIFASVAFSQTGWVDDGAVVRLETASDSVGIGTSTPGIKLRVNVDTGGEIARFEAGPSGDSFISTFAGASQSYLFTNRDGYSGVGSITNHGFALRTYNSDRVYITSGGDVGIGTTNPSAKLDVNGNVNIAGQVTAGGKNLNNASIQESDYIIFRETDGGYRAVRCSDGTILQNNGDAAVVINGLLNSLGPVVSNVKVKLKGGIYHIYQTIVIPPNQDFVFEADQSALINANLAYADIIRIDSSMNSKFTFGIVVTPVGGDGNTCVRIKPQTIGPDSMIVFTTNELYIEAVVGAADGLTLDASLGTIEFLKGRIKELNLYGGTSSKRGIYIPAPGSGSVVRGNELTVGRVNAASEVAKVVTNSSTRKNLYWINNADNEGIPINIASNNNNKTKAPFPSGW